MKKDLTKDEFLRKRAERQRRIRKRRLKILFCLIIIFLLALSVILCLTVFFPIEKIIVKGSKTYKAEQIIKASDIEIGDNLFVTSKGDALKKLKAELPYVEDIEFERELSGKLTITVKDAVPYACYYSDGMYYTVSKLGYVLEALEEKPDSLFEIRASGIKCSLGKAVTFTSEKTEDLIYEIGGYAEDYGLSLDYIDVTDELAITAKAENRFIVNFGTSNFLSNKFAHLSSMIKNILQIWF